MPVKEIGEVKQIARPRYYQGSDPDRAILIIHGFTGHPGDMEYLGKELNQNLDLTVSIPRLSGHGTSAADFRSTDASDWLRAAIDSYLDLKVNFDKIIVAGLSMGGLLSLQIANGFAVDKMILIAPALYSTDRKIPVTHFLRLFKIKMEQANYNETLENSETEEERLIAEDYYRYHYSAQVAELHKLMVSTRKIISDIRVPALIISSLKDKIVPLKAGKEIYEQLNGPATLEIFEESPHVINDGPERDLCADKITEFIKK
ncbi:MAG: alpha/beta hydrolase [Bacillota bacterium]